ncbi:hypothetical protein ABZ769_33875 [Streptomyces olivoreticuli]
MSLPLIRLAIGPTNGTAHYGVLLNGTEPVTACATHSPDLRAIAPNTSHQMCHSCTRAWLIFSTSPHPGGEPEARPAAGAGKGAVAHRSIPGHLLGYCGKLLDNRRTSARRICANCTRLSNALERFQRRAGELLLPPAGPCHGDDALLWASKGRSDMVTGHRRNSATGKAHCEQLLAGPSPGAQECAACQRHWEEAEAIRQIHILPVMREETAGWEQCTLDVFDERACAVEAGDAYTVSGCPERHHVVAVADRSRESHTDLFVYLSGEDRVTDVRVRRERLVTVQRPAREVGLNPVPMST